MSFKNYKKGLRKIEDQALENSRHLYDTYKIPKKKPYNCWWNRQKHPGWAAYHANKDKN